MNSTVIGLLFVVLILVVALVVFLLTRKETPKPKEFSFQIDNLGMSIEKTKPVESYELRNLDDIEKPADDNDSDIAIRDYLNKFIDFQIAWTNPSTDMLSESVAYLKLKRTLPSGSVYNYYIVNQDILDVDDVIPVAATGEKNIVYKPTSVNGVQAVGASDTAANAGDDNFFSPGAEVKLMLYGFDLNAGEDLSGLHVLKLYYLVDGEVERLATIDEPNVESAVKEVQMSARLSKNELYVFDFSGSTQSTTISLGIVFYTFGEEFVGAFDNTFNSAGAMFRMCFVDREMSSRSYKWLIKDGDNNIKVQNTSFRHGSDDQNSSLVTSGSNVLPNFNDPNICRFKVILTYIRNGIKLGIGDGFLKYNENPSGSESVLTVVDNQTEGTIFYILKNKSDGDLCYLVYIPLDLTLEAIFFIYDSDSNKLTTITHSQIDNLQYAAFCYIEEITDLDNLDTIMAVCKYIRNEDRTYRSSFNLISYTEKLVEPVHAYIKLDGQDVGSSVYRVNPFKMYTVRSVGIHSITGNLSELSEEYYNGDYIRFIFQKVNDPEYENVYQIKTKNRITQDLKQGPTFQAQIDTQMYLQNHITANNKFTLLTDTGDISIPAYESVRLNVQVFSVPRTVVSTDTEREIILLLYDETKKSHIVSYTENGVHLNDMSVKPFISIDNYSIINK